MCFEIGRLPGEQRIGGGVALIKSVASKFFDQSKRFLCLRSWESFGCCPFYKLFPKCVDRLSLFFADRFDARIGAGEFDAPKTLRIRITCS